MKRTIKALLGLAVVAIVFSSCGAENDILGQFSKRKYLKKSKATKQYELAEVEDLEQRQQINLVAESSASPELILGSEKVEEELILEEKGTFSSYSAPKLSTNITKDWSAYNRPYSSNPMYVANQSIEFTETMNVSQVQRASDVVLIILCIFLPPVAVVLYEDTVTGNFWLDLVLTLLFWLPGMIFAFLVCFADVSI